MNPQSDSNSALNPNDAIIEGEIIKTHHNHPDDQGIDLELMEFNGDFKENIEQEPSIAFKLTPWGLGALALFLFSNLLLTWAQFSKLPSLEPSQPLSELPSLPEIVPNAPSQPEITPDALSIIPGPLSSPSVVPSPPNNPTTAKILTPSNPPQATLPQRLLPSSLRPQPQPVTVTPQIARPPVSVLPVSVETRKQAPQPVYVPPTVQPEPVEAPLPPEPPELSKEEQLRNILRQQIIREEAENQPPLTFNQRYRQEMLDKKLREVRAAQPAATQEAVSAPPNVVSQPSQSQTPAVVPPTSPASSTPSPTVSNRPQNVNQLVNQLESLNQKR